MTDGIGDERPTDYPVRLLTDHERWLNAERRVEVLKTENEQLRRIVDSVTSKTALDVVADKLTAQDEARRLRGALDEVLTAFSRMPDAGLKPNDPRYAWWYETAEARKRGREALVAAKRTTEGTP